MALFKRRKNQTVAELEEYYASKQTRSGMAWVMAVVSLIITILVVSALFFGGRWVYRSLTDDSTEVTVTTTETNGSDENVNDFGETESETEAGENFPSVVSDQAASTTTPNSSSPSNSTPSTVGVDDDLPETGAGEILIIAPITAMIAGYIISRKYQLQNK